MRHDLARRMEAFAYCSSVFRVNQFDGVPNQMSEGLKSIFFLTNVHPLDTPDEREGYIARIAAMEPPSRHLLEEMRSQAALGFKLPGQSVTLTLRKCHAAIAGDLDRHPSSSACAAPWRERRTCRRPRRDL